MHAAYACCACCVLRTRTRAGTGGAMAMLWARRICARTLATSRGASQGNAITVRGRDATQRDATSQSNAEPRHATQRGRPCAWPPAHPHLSTQLTPGVQGRSPCVAMSMKRRLNSAHSSAGRKPSCHDWQPSDCRHTRTRRRISRSACRLWATYKVGGRAGGLRGGWGVGGRVGGGAGGCVGRCIARRVGWCVCGRVRGRACGDFGCSGGIG